MRRLIFLFIILATYTSAGAVSTLLENFNGPSFDSGGFSIYAPGLQNCGAPGTFDGSGHYMMTRDDCISRSIGIGDFRMQVVFNAIDMGTPSDSTSNRIFYCPAYNHIGNNTEQLWVYFYKDSAGTYFFVDKYTTAGGQTHEYGEAFSSLTSATIMISYNDATHTYAVSAGFDGGAVVSKISVSMPSAANASRIEYFYGSTTPACSSDSISLDQYQMTSGQTPYSQIDSLDDLANWTNFGEQTSLDTTIFHEGVASMKVTYGQGLIWDIQPYRAGSYNWAYSQPSMLTFWQKSALAGTERVNQIILYDLANHIARYTCALPKNTNWNKILCPLGSFTFDSGVFDWTNVMKIQIWFTSSPNMGSSVWVDDIRIESFGTPVPPFQISAMDNIVFEGWTDTHNTGLMMQETGVVQQGTGAMKIAFPGPSGVFQVGPRKVFTPAIDFNDYQHQAISVWVWRSDLSNETSRLFQFIVYDSSGHLGRYYVSTPANTGWQKVLMPCKDFQWEVSATGQLVDVSQVNWHSISIIDMWMSQYPIPGPAIYIDDIEAVIADPEPSQAWVVNAQETTAPMTIDANPSDWANLTDSDWLDFGLSLVPVQPNGNLHVKYKMAWDPNYLYILVQEQPGDGLASEAQGVGEPAGYGLNDGVGGAEYYDNLALFFDFTNNHLPGVGTQISLWLFCGLSSTNRTDMMMAWTNGHWGPHDASAITHGACATKGTLGSRVFEAKIKWSDLDADIESVRLPAGGLASAVKPGYVFGCDPRLNDFEEQASPWTPSSEASAAWFNGNLWSNLPSGKDVYSTDVRLVCKKSDFNGDCKVNFTDFAVMAKQWLLANCSDLNAYCNGSDTDYSGSVNFSDVQSLAAEWLK